MKKRGTSFSLGCVTFQRPVGDPTRVLIGRNILKGKIYIRRKLELSVLDTSLISENYREYLNKQNRT